jgi:uncharacterized FAD-dependent dehydrogenase
MWSWCDNPEGGVVYENEQNTFYTFHGIHSEQLRQQRFRRQAGENRP